MNPIVTERLESVIDTLAEALFFQRPLPGAECNAAIRWIVRRQGLPGSYADMFAPTDAERKGGIRLFTGEVVRSRAGVGHLLGEEACRQLTLLGCDDPAVQAALARAVAGMTQRLAESTARGAAPGTYCCGTCTVGYWRNLALGVFPRAQANLRAGLAQLARHRQPDGTWQRYPFYFTSLALVEIGPSLAESELRHAAPSWQRVLPRLKRAAAHDAIARRRAAVGDQLLALCV